MYTFKTTSMNLCFETYPAMFHSPSVAFQVCSPEPLIFAPFQQSHPVHSTHDHFLRSAALQCEHEYELYRLALQEEYERRRRLEQLQRQQEEERLKQIARQYQQERQRILARRGQREQLAMQQRLQQQQAYLQAQQEALAKRRRQQAQLGLFSLFRDIMSDDDMEEPYLTSLRRNKMTDPETESPGNQAEMEVDVPFMFFGINDDDTSDSDSEDLEDEPSHHQETTRNIDRATKATTEASTSYATQDQQDNSQEAEDSEMHDSENNLEQAQDTPISEDPSQDTSSETSKPSTTSDDAKLAQRLQLQLISEYLDNLDIKHKETVAHTTLAFEDSDDVLATTPDNRQFLGLEDQVMRVLFQLDSIDSDGDEQIRKERKALVKRAEALLSRLDAHKQQEWERASTSSQESK